MEITNPSSLWKDYDAAALPICEYALSEKSVNGFSVKEYYFDGLYAADGKVRAFISITEHPESKGVIIYMPNRNGVVGDEVPQELVSRGYTVAVLDYIGKAEDNARFTLYPKSLSDCNCYGVKEFTAPQDALTSCWYVWTCLARRAKLLLDKLYPGMHIFALGNGLGGSTVYKLSTFNDGFTACATMLNVLPTMRGSGNHLINYRAALDNTAYASLGKVPMMMTIASNDEDKMFDEMSELVAETVSLKSFRIIERAFSSGISLTYDQIDHFFTAIATGGKLPPKPRIKPVNSNNKLYYNIDIDDSESCTEIKSANFYCAFRIDNPMHRNWTNVSLVSLGNNQYMAHVFVLDSNKPIYTFINITDENGDISSSELVTLIPKTLGLVAQQPNSARRRLIYESEMGKDLWTSPKGGNVNAESGPFGINGVTSDRNSLATFKPGDLLYKTDDDSFLQLIISGKKQKLTISVFDETDKYSCEVELSGDEWNKFTLKSSDMMSSVHHLEYWSKIVLLMIEGCDKFLISSVIWV